MASISLDFLASNAISLASSAERAGRLLACREKLAEEEPQRVASIQSDRFRLWASHIGVFSDRHSSLDYRLRTAPTAKVAVAANLETLCGHLLCVLMGISDLPDEKAQACGDIEDAYVSDYGMGLLRKSSPAVDIRLSMLMFVESTITTLHRLSLAIRRASNRNSITRLPRLVQADEAYTVYRQVDENLPQSGTDVPAVKYDASAPFEEFVGRVLVLRWLTPSNDLEPDETTYRNTLMKRCISSITTRRRQLTYFRSHQTKLELPGRNLAANKPYGHLGDDIQPHGKGGEMQENPEASHADKGRIKSGVEIFSKSSVTGTIASQFDPNSFKISRSIAASSSTGSTSVGGMGLAEAFEVPPAPKLKDTEKERMCPYCCLVLDAKVFSTQRRSRRWRKHIMEDLQPYICLFSSCIQADKTFQTFREWQTHLNTSHYEGWRCPIPHSDRTISEVTFDTAEPFREHLIDFHPEQEDADIRTMIRSSGHRARMPERCFVCLNSQLSDMAMRKHLAKHLENAFLLALPSRDDIEGTDTVSSGRPANVSAQGHGGGSQDGDLPDISRLYAENSGQTTTGDDLGLPSLNFASQLAEVATNATPQETQRMLDNWVQELPDDLEQELPEDTGLLDGRLGSGGITIYTGDETEDKTREKLLADGSLLKCELEDLEDTHGRSSYEYMQKEKDYNISRWRLQLFDAVELKEQRERTKPSGKAKKDLDALKAEIAMIEANLKETDTVSSLPHKTSRGSAGTKLESVANT